MFQNWICISASKERMLFASQYHVLKDYLQKIYEHGQNLSEEYQNIFLKLKRTLNFLIDPWSEMLVNYINKYKIFSKYISWSRISKLHKDYL